MSDRYFAKVVVVRDKYTVVINAGSLRDVQPGKRFLLIGLGEVIVDPDTNEELERLEIVRGTAVVTHVQEKIATLRSADYDKPRDEREITKVTTRGGTAYALLSRNAQDTVTETVKPAEPILRALHGAQVGDFAIAA